jgi:hypothetical protein
MGKITKLKKTRAKSLFDMKVGAEMLKRANSPFVLKT